jgi:NAD(P)-dependent dehydrogenase (short-subunit alcohol dehydrogenase family)
MQYFVTGATGFIGKRLVKALLARRGTTVHFLLRPGSEDKVPALREYWGVNAQRAHAVTGDLTAKKLGVSADDLKTLKGHVDAVYHLAAVYDLGADEDSQVQVNIEGTRHVCEFAKAVEAATCITCRRSRRRAFTKACFARTCSTRPRTSSTVLMTKHESGKDRAQGARRRGPCTAPRWWWATASPARWTRSTGRTISSS